jgi:hypothetical protein
MRLLGVLAGAARLASPFTATACRSGYRAPASLSSSAERPRSRSPVARMLPRVIGGPASDRGHAHAGEDTASAGRSESWPGSAAVSLSPCAMARGGPTGEPISGGAIQQGSCPKNDPDRLAAAARGGLPHLARAVFGAILGFRRKLPSSRTCFGVAD